MFVIPKSEVTLGRAKFYGTQSGVNSITIQQSVDAIGNTAKITLPRNFKREDAKGLLDYIQVGDNAIIRLGYGTDIETEFVGYISKIGDGTPLVIELEDEWYHFKNQTLNKVFASTTLTDILQFIFQGWTIKQKISVNLSNGFVIRNASTYEVAKRLKDEFGFCIRIDAANKKVYAFYPFDFAGFSSHRYVFGTYNGVLISELRDKGMFPNVAKNNLNFTRKEDLKLQITAKGVDRAGKKISCQIGSTDSRAEKRTLNFGTQVQDKEELKARAEAEIKKHSFDGYTGKITGFGLPRTMAGDTLQLIDPENPEREGKYLIKSVAISYSINNGLRRENELSYKI